MDSIKQQSLSADITRVVNDYQQIFGDLNLPDDLSAAEEQLEKLVKQKKDQEKGKIKKIEPQDRALRLAEYDGFCLKSAAEKRQQQTDDLMIDIAAMHSETDAQQSNRVKSRLEILSEERDYKRRRQSYKGGKTGSAKRSYTEVIRDVIDTQSDMLRTIINDDKKLIKREPS